MFFEKIHFDGISIYRTNVIDVVDCNKLRKSGNSLRNFLPEKQISKKDAPGIQINLTTGHHNTLELDKVYNLCIDSYCNIHKVNMTEWYGESWFFISEQTLRDSNYHTHLHMVNPPPFTGIPVTFTSVLYVSLPEVINEREGAIRFKTETGLEYDVYPKLGDLIWFPANLQHRPLLNPSSNSPRYTIGTNYYIHKKAGGGSLI